MIEFEPTSQWYNSSLTMAAGWAKQGGVVGYNGFVQPPERVRAQLIGLGLNVEELERNNRFWLYDWYSPTLGRRSKDGIESLKVADLSIQFRLMDDLNEPDPEWFESLRIADNFSTLARFNDEKSWIEFMLTRVFPIGSVLKSTLIFGIMKGVHSEWAYRQLEGSADGVVEFRLQDFGQETRDVVQVRSMRNVHYCRELTELKVNENFLVQLKT
jgi:KaiC/GvpD/RAD55 family RecA-like ATPase